MMEVEHGEKAPSGLTWAHERFALEYIKRYDKTAAALAAGYSEKTAGQQGYQLANRPDIKKRVSELQQNIAELAGITPLMVANELAAIAFTNMSDIFADWTERQNYDDLDDVQKKAIKTIEFRKEVRSVPTQGDEEINIEIETVKVVMHDKLKAIELLCKNLGFTMADTVNLNHTLPPDATINIVVNSSGVPLADSENEEPKRD